MSTVVKISGTTSRASRGRSSPRRCPVVRGGVPSFSFQVRGGPLPSLPDPYLGATVTVEIGWTVYFVGEVVSVSAPFEDNGWVRTYQAIGLRGVGDKVALTDPTSLIDVSAFNLQFEDPNYIAPGPAGRSAR